MKTVSDIIDAFGGNTAMASILKKQPSTVSEMRRRGRIDVSYWSVLKNAAMDADLAEMQARKTFELSNDILVDAHTPQPACP